MVHHKSRDNPAAVVCDSPRVILLDELPHPGQAWSPLQWAKPGCRKTLN
jgi:hypothetical protein